MKTLITALILATLALPAAADTLCDKIGNLAESTMEARQSGVTLDAIGKDNSKTNTGIGGVGPWRPQCSH